MIKQPLVLSSEEYFGYQHYTRSLGVGEFGKIFPYNKREVLKLWHEDINSLVLDEYTKNISTLLNYKFHTLMLANRLVLYNDKIVGYIMKYFNGINLKDIPDKASYKSLINAMQRLERELKKFSSNNLIIDDAHDKNIMYYEKLNKGIVACVDCDSWKKDLTKSTSSCYKHNITEVNTTFVNTLLRNNSKIIDFIENSKLNERLEQIDYNVSLELSSFFKDLQLEIEKYYNEQIINLGDLKRVLK